MSEAVAAPEAAPEAPETPAEPTPGLGRETPTPETPMPGFPAWDSVKGALAPELRDQPVLATIKDLPDLVTRFVHAERLVGGEKIHRPTEKSPPQDWDRFYNALGRPENADGYDLGDFAPPEGLPWDEGLQKSLLPELHKAGLTNQQVNAVVRSYAEKQAESLAAQQQQQTEQMQTLERELKQKYGQAYESKVSLANRLFARMFGDRYQEMAQVKLADGHTLGNHPVFIEAFLAAAEALGEDKLVGQGEVPAILEPATAQERAREFEQQHHKALTDKKHPEHLIRNREWDALYRQAYPEET